MRYSHVHCFLTNFRIVPSFSKQSQLFSKSFNTMMFLYLFVMEPILKLTYQCVEHVMIFTVIPGFMNNKL